MIGAVGDECRARPQLLAILFANANIGNRVPGFLVRVFGMGRALHQPFHALAKPVMVVGNIKQ
jgi:hypothetical protein